MPEETPTGLPVPLPAQTGVQRLSSPTAYASQIQVSQAGNDITLIFAAPHPVITKENPQSAALMEDTAIVHISLATLKDFSIAAAEVIAREEAKFGEIKTDFTLARAKAAVAQKS